MLASVRGTGSVGNPPTSVFSPPRLDYFRVSRVGVERGELSYSYEFISVTQSTYGWISLRSCLKDTERRLMRARGWKSAKPLLSETTTKNFDDVSSPPSSARSRFLAQRPGLSWFRGCSVFIDTTIDRPIFLCTSYNSYVLKCNDRF